MTNLSIALEEAAVQREQLRRRLIDKVDAKLGHGPDKNRVPTIAEIVRQVALKHFLTAHELLSTDRRVEVCLARHEAMWRCRMETRHSTGTIGRIFRKDHTAVIYGIRKHAARLQGLHYTKHKPKDANG